MWFVFLCAMCAVVEGGEIAGERAVVISPGYRAMCHSDLPPCRPPSMFLCAMHAVRLHTDVLAGAFNIDVCHVSRGDLV